MSRTWRVKSCLPLLSIDKHATRWKPGDCSWTSLPTALVQYRRTDIDKSDTSYINLRTMAKLRKPEREPTRKSERIQTAKAAKQSVKNKLVSETSSKMSKL